MCVRLAFAVAAHLEPEILIVDEVLAVGDASFQKNAWPRWMESGEGRTVLFVSHNLAAVTRLCSRGVLLRQGRVVADAPVTKVVATYLGGAFGELRPPSTSPSASASRARRTSRSCSLHRIASDSLDDGVVDIRQPVRIEMDYEVLQERRQIAPNIHLFTDEGHCAFIASDASTPESRLPKKPGQYRVTAEIQATSSPKV